MSEKLNKIDLMLLSNSTFCEKKKITFIKNQKLSNDQFKMNKIISKFLLTGDKFEPQLQQVI